MIVAACRKPLGARCASRSPRRACSRPGAPSTTSTPIRPGRGSAPAALSASRSRGSCGGSGTAASMAQRRRRPSRRVPSATMGEMPPQLPFAAMERAFVAIAAGDLDDAAAALEDMRRAYAALAADDRAAMLPLARLLRARLDAARSARASGADDPDDLLGLLGLAAYRPGQREV